MNVLVTNDDGYGAWGIEALINALSERHNVFVIAPDGNRSGNSHHISLGNKLILKKAGTNHWVSSGTPADCVYSATKYDMFGVKIDAVVSGINKGENLGMISGELADIAAELWKIQEESDIEPAYLAQWDYKNSYYRIWGKVSEQEMEAIVKNIMY